MEIYDPRRRRDRRREAAAPAETALSFPGLPATSAGQPPSPYTAPSGFRGDQPYPRRVGGPGSQVVVDPLSGMPSFSQWQSDWQRRYDAEEARRRAAVAPTWNNPTSIPDPDWDDPANWDERTREVQGLYENYLGRRADEEGLEFWTNYDGNLRDSFLYAAEPEYRDYNTGMYDMYFNRAPDQEGLDFWTGARTGGLNYLGTHEGFATADEPSDFDYQRYLANRLDFSQPFLEQPGYFSGGSAGYTPDFRALNAERSVFEPTYQNRERQQQAFNMMEGAQSPFGVMPPSYAQAGFGQVSGDPNSFGPALGGGRAAIEGNTPGINNDWLSGVYDPQAQQATGVYQPSGQQNGNQGGLGGLGGSGFGSVFGSGWGR